MAVKLALVKRARLCRPERALVVTVVLVLALLTLRQAPLPPSTPPPSLTTTDPSEVPLVDSRTPVKALSSRAWPKVVRPVATLQTAMPISKPLVQLPEDVWGNSERFGAWYCAKDISASTQFTSHESFKRLTGDARSAALALNAAFIKGSMLRGAAAAYAGGLPSHYSPPCVLGTLVVEADFTSWLQITAGWSAPLAHLTLVANTDSKHVMSIVRDITAALASAGHGIVLEQFPENRGVAQGWNAAWNSVAPYSDVDWMLLMNADFQVECSTLRSYLAETHHLQSTRNQNLSNVINATAAEHWDPVNDLNGVPAPKGGFDRCRRLTRGLTRVPNPTDDDASPVAVHHLVQWAALVVFRIAIEAIGAFDGNVWPAYSEDIEWCVRIRVHGGFTRTFFTMKPNGHRRSISCSDKPTDCGVVHRSSTVLRKDTRFADMTARWGRGEYLFRKWGFNRREAPKAITPSFCPYLTPFDVPYLSIGEGVEGNIDPNHRKCVEGKLPEANLRYTGAGCNACFFNATSLIAKVADRLDPARREKLQGRLGSRNCAGVPNY